MTAGGIIMRSRCAIKWAERRRPIAPSVGLYALSLDERGADLCFHRRVGFRFDNLSHSPGGGFAQILLGDMDGGEWGRE